MIIDFVYHLQTLKFTTFTLCSCVPKRNETSPFKICINSDNDVSISYKNLRNIGPVTSEFKRVECGIFATTRPQFDDRPSLGTLAFRNELEYCDFGFSTLIGNHFSTLCRNLVRYGLVTLDCKTQEFLRPALIILPRLVHLCSLGSGLSGTAVISDWVCFISTR